MAIGPFNRRNDNALANQILVYLNRHDKKNQYHKTKGIIRAITDTDPVLDYDEDYIHIRDVLNRMQRAGLLKKNIRSKTTHLWMINVSRWDAADPFYGRTMTDPIGTMEDTTTPDDDGSEESGTGDDAAQINVDAITAPLRREISELESKNNLLKDQLQTQTEQVVELSDEVAKLKEVQRAKPITYEIKKLDGKKKIIKDVIRPKHFERMLRLAEKRRNILLIGPAGCGKTFGAELLAKVMDLDFYPMSMNEEIGKAEILGVRDINATKGTSTFNTSPFATAYESGGICLLDELDAANPNGLLMMNSALANSYISLPLRKNNPIAKRDKDFICVATANTFGTGADRQYVGRNQLDESTLDRFGIGRILVSYDESVEMNLCPDEELRKTLHRIRANIDKYKIRKVMSTRFLEDAFIMKEAGWSVSDILESYFIGWRQEEEIRAKEGINFAGEASV